MIMRGNTKSEVYLVEIIAIVLLCIAVFEFMSVFSIPSYEPNYSNEKLVTLGNDILLSLNCPRDDVPDEYHNSKLTELIIENNITELTNVLNASLPETVSYNIYMRNSTSRIPLYISGTPHGDTAVSHQIISHYNTTSNIVQIWDIELVLWYEIRAK